MINPYAFQYESSCLTSADNTKIWDDIWQWRQSVHTIFFLFFLFFFFFFFYSRIHSKPSTRGKVRQARVIFFICLVCTWTTRTLMSASRIAVNAYIGSHLSSTKYSHKIILNILGRMRTPVREYASLNELKRERKRPSSLFSFWIWSVSF